MTKFYFFFDWENFRRKNFRRRRKFFQLVNTLGMGFGQIQKKQYRYSGYSISINGTFRETETLIFRNEIQESFKLISYYRNNNYLRTGHASVRTERPGGAIGDRSAPDRSPHELFRPEAGDCHSLPGRGTVAKS